MSVPVFKRGVSKLKVLNDAKILAIYTLNTCSNEKYFPKKYRWSFTKPLIDEALNMIRCIYSANSIKAENIHDHETRLKLQKEALMHLQTILPMLDLSYSMFPIATNKIEYWTNLCVETEKSLRAWIKWEKEQIK